MSHWIIYHNPQCSKSREALSFLRSKNIEPKVIEYLKEAPTEAELRDVLAKLEAPAASLVRTKEDLYKELSFDVKSDDEVIRHLAKHPKLLERPIVIKDDRAVIARPTELIETLL